MSSDDLEQRGQSSTKAAFVFSALGDPTRLELLMRLSDGRTSSIAGLSGSTKLTRQAVTKHLHVLERAGLVINSRVGRETQYAFRPEPIEDARAYLAGVSKQWEDALSRLRSFIERDAQGPGS